MLTITNKATVTSMLGKQPWGGGIRWKVEGFHNLCLDGQTERMRNGHQPHVGRIHAESMNSEGELTPTGHTERAVLLAVSDHVPRPAGKHQGA